MKKQKHKLQHIFISLKFGLVQKKLALSYYNGTSTFIQARESEQQTPEFEDTYHKTDKVGVGQGAEHSSLDPSTGHRYISLPSPIFHRHANIEAKLFGFY